MVLDERGRGGIKVLPRRVDDGYKSIYELE